LNELNYRLEANVKRARGKTFLGAGLRLGASHSTNFGDIFSAALSGTLSRTLNNRTRFEGSGFVSYDDNKYYMSAFSLGLELTL
jgi:hypothetical protein